MRVTQILYSGLGGHGNVAFSLRNQAHEQSAWRDAMIFLGIEPLLPEYAQLCDHATIPYRYVEAVAGSPWRSWRNVYRSLVELRPEAIILHSVKAIVPCWLYARSLGVPVIAVEHQNNALKSTAERWVSRLLMYLADAVVVLTPEYRSALREVVGIHWRDDKVQVIPNGIDTVKHSPSQSDRARMPPPRRIGMAARFSSIKRHDVLVGALSILVNRDGPDTWKLSLAGNGDTLDSVASQVSALGLQEQVELPGYLGEKELCTWFRSLDIYAHASEGETLSTSILQAMSMGLPIAGSNVSGINSMLDSGEGVGLLARDQSAESFAAALTQLAEDPELAQALGARARTLALSEYGQDVMFSRYQQLLQSCKKLST